MGLLNKAAILGADDLKHEDVEVKQWGGTVRIRVMTGAERDAFHEAYRAASATEGGAPAGKINASLVAATCIDEAGALLFTRDDIEALRGKSATSIDTLTAVAMRLNGIGGSAVDDAAKNSESDQSGDSGSGSQKS